MQPNKLSPGPEALPLEVGDHIDELFALDAKIAADSGTLFPLDTPQELLDFLTADHQCDTYVWRGEDEQLVGYLSVVDAPEEEALEVLFVGVDPDMQEGGYGSKMMDFAEELAQGLSRKRVILVTRADNHRAIDFYKRKDYEITEEVKDRYGDGQRRYRLEKWLELTQKPDEPVSDGRLVG